MKPFQAVILVVSLLGLALGGLVVFRYFIPLSNYAVSSNSMAPTLRRHEQVLSNAQRSLCNIRNPLQGQVVVLRSGNVRYIKRLIAGPGQTVEMRDGRLVIDKVPVKAAALGPNTLDDSGGAAVRETLPNGVVYQTLDLGPYSAVDNFGPATVPEGHWFVLGDHRDNSADSRLPHEAGGLGMVPVLDLCGQVTSILISPDPKRQGLKL